MASIMQDVIKSLFCFKSITRVVIIMSFRVTFEEILFHPELDPDDTNEFTPEEAVVSEFRLVVEHDITVYRLEVKSTPLPGTIILPSNYTLVTLNKIYLFTCFAAQEFDIF